MDYHNSKRNVDDCIFCRLHSTHWRLMLARPRASPSYDTVFHIDLLHLVADNRSTLFVVQWGWLLPEQLVQQHISSL